ncbi:MAG: hypothetical protein OWT28_02555 [Firmicutes bacterium]|nr:hypothetical protein [Bacillota bacterium]
MQTWISRTYTAVIPVVVPVLIGSATLLVAPLAHADTGTIPPGMHPFIGSGGEGATSIFAIIQSVASNVVMVMEIIVGAVVLGFFYLGIVNFIRGSRVADRRTEGKTQLMYAFIAAVLLGMGAVLLSALYAWGQSIHG